MSSRNTYLLVLLIAVVSTLPWIGLGDFYTKGEPREASVAVSMLDDGDWILPRVYADEIAYKPPLTHWMIALCSLPTGEVTPFTSRLPSVIAFIIMTAFCFSFFSRFMKRNESLAAILIFISCFEIHRASMTSRVDMVLTAFMVCGLIGLFYWSEDKKLKGLPWYIPLLLGGATLAKGPVGVVLPLLVFGVYLLFTRWKLTTIVLKCLLVTLLSLIPLSIWYYLAYRQVGDSFVDLVWAENVGRFLGSDNLKISYDLGHEHPFWYNFTLLVTGFIPWTLFLLFSLFAINYRFKRPRNIWSRFLSMERGKLFSLIAACLIFLFYCIPISKRGTYLMPAYPFIAVFFGQFIYSFAVKHSRVNRAFAVFLGSIIGIVAVLSTLILLNLVELQNIASVFTQKDKTLFHATLINDGLSTPTVLFIFLLVSLFAALGILVVHFRRKNQKGILFATFGIWIMCNILLDGAVLPAFKDGTSVRSFAGEISNKYPLKEGNMYVMNNLRKYRNLYGLNFYLQNRFMNFEKEQPEEGFFFSTPFDIDRIKDEYKEYSFELLEQTPNRFNDARAVIQLYKIKKEPTQSLL